jgi:hypothetical protein
MNLPGLIITGLKIAKIMILYLTLAGFFSLEISVVVASASIYSNSSRFDMCSRRFSFFRSLKTLYYMVVNFGKRISNYAYYALHLNVLSKFQLINPLNIPT